MNRHEAAALWSQDRGQLERLGVSLPMVNSYLPDEYRYDYGLAMDAQPALSTTDPNSAVPMIFTTMVDPKVFKALFAPNKAATIMGEERRGTWIDDTIMLPVTEAIGEVSSYGDYAESGNVNANVNWPQRQAYLFQIVKQYGERELERAGAARINWVAELDYAAAMMLNKFANYTYFYGISSLQNYGLLNDPHLNASLTPATKGWGGTGWYNASSQVVATANEIFLDIENTFGQLVAQTAGAVNQETKMTLALSPSSKAALTTTNSFNVNVNKIIKDNFANLEIVDAVQYGAISASNPQGNPAGNFMQLIAHEVDGQQTGYCGFNEKMRAHKLIPAMSSYRQKVSGGTWGCILRTTSPIASMIGI